MKEIFLNGNYFFKKIEVFCIKICCLSRKFQKKLIFFYFFRVSCYIKIRQYKFHLKIKNLKFFSIIFSFMSMFFIFYISFLTT